MTTPAEYGAAMLDEHLPGWADRIDTDHLDLASGCDCVLGQLYGTFGAGVVAVFGRRAFYASTAAVDCGFDVLADERDQYDDLTGEWRDLIHERVGQRVTA